MPFPSVKLSEVAAKAKVDSFEYTGVAEPRWLKMARITQVCLIWIA